MSELSHYYNEVACNSSTWSHPDKKHCGCRGSGWWLSELDTWHECPYHDGPHPDHDDEGNYDDMVVVIPEPRSPRPEDDDIPF
jgi:hypothetical protein